MTKVEDRIESVEKWIANFQEGNEESLVFSNMNFLVAQLKGQKFLKDLQEDANATEEGEDTEDDK